MFACAAIPTIALMIGVIFIPESPRWLAQKGRFDGAFAVMSRIEGKAKAGQELHALKDSLATQEGSWRELLWPGMRMALIVGVGLCFLQGWSGGAAVNFYAPLIFQKASSVGASGAIFQTLMLNVSSLVFTTAALFMVDIVGRRPMLLVGAIGMALSHAFLGLCLYKEFPGGYTVAAVFLFNMFFQISMGPLAWLILSEIFPTHLRAKGQSAGTLAVWVSTYLSNQFLGPVMNYFQNKFGSVGPAFWIFGILCVFILIFGWKLVPETKQRSLEEIAAWWQQRPEPVAGR
jgi:SP family arabinose:H+ symporter-like MFS transporter